MTPTLVPLPDGSVTSPQGFTAAAAHAGLKPDGAPDVALVVSSASCATAGVFAKGSGMIHPDMATLLAVLTTDAAAEPAQLAPLLRRVADRTFNAISVDGDTSTNDTVLLLANGTAGVDPARDGALWKLFEEAVQQVARHLALAIVSDGEGASTLLEIHVVRTASETAAREVGRAVARSVLVKTALYGADPNWGRVLAAAEIGRASCRERGWIWGVVV